MRSRTRRVSRKNGSFINFVQCHARCRVSIGFSCTILEIQNTTHSKCIST
ncbi:hypothetical protein B296_00038138 [Ensete ventricosum]|uniref:Uncharacterized protein n=1 Tax=Ensete ventricosum TaxID=4639 RepID=A0A426X767_ENSVE|nr:hypothetical protein B296_00038138 [Ensete ventricosum]